MTLVVPLLNLLEAFRRLHLNVPLTRSKCHTSRTNNSTLCMECRMLVYLILSITIFKININRLIARLSLTSNSPPT